MIAHNYYAFADYEDKFFPGEEVSGKLVDFLYNWKETLEYLLLETDDGRYACLNVHYLRKFPDITSHLELGDRFTIKKMAYSSRRQHTAWAVKALPLHIMQSLPQDVVDKMRYQSLPWQNRTKWLELDSDFEDGTTEEATIKSFYGSRKHPMFAIVEMTDGAVSRVSAQSFHESRKDIHNYKVGDKLKLVKNGFIPGYNITKWKVFNYSSPKEQKAQNQPWLYKILRYFFS